MKLLICGGAGFIGSNFVRLMVNKYPDYKIVNYDKLTYAGNLDNLKDIEGKSNYAFMKGDITDLDKLNEVIKEHDITHIINFAAETHVDRSIHGGCKDFVLTNVLGVQMLLDAAKTNNIEKMVNVSTDEVFGDLDLDDERKFDEKWPIMPNMPYAAAKAGGDLMCNAYFVFKLLAGEKVPVYGDGLNVRDWIHVLDHGKALDLLLHKGNPGEVYNIGSDNERNNMELTQMILKVLGKDEEMIEYVTDRPGHDRKYAIDATKIKALGWVPDYPREKFEEGLRETVEWYKNNTEWVENVRAKKKDEMNKFQENIDKSDKPQESAKK